MSGLINKVKDAIHHKDDERDHSQSVAHGDTVAPTNPGVLSSTKPGIHGARDTGTSGHGISNAELTGQVDPSSAASQETGSVAHGDHISPTNPGILHSTKPGLHGARDSGTGASGLSNAELMKDEGLGAAGLEGRRSGEARRQEVESTGPAVTHRQQKHQQRREKGYGDDNSVPGSGLTGAASSDSGPTVTQHQQQWREEGYGDNNAPGSGLTGAIGSDSGPTVTQHQQQRREEGYGDNNAPGSGLTGAIGSGLGSTTIQHQQQRREEGYGDNNVSGSGLAGPGGGYGSGYDNSRGTGLTDSGPTSTADNTAGTGLTGFVGDESKARSENPTYGSGYTAEATTHRSGDGYVEDTLHPGPHQTRAGNILDPRVDRGPE